MLLSTKLIIIKTNSLFFSKTLIIFWLLTIHLVMLMSCATRKTHQRTIGPVSLLSSEDMLKSAVIEEKKFKHSPWAGADNPLGPKFWCKQEGLITMVICCKFEKNLNLWPYTHLFMIYQNVYSCRSGADNPRGWNFYVNRNLLSLRSFITSLKKNLWFYTIFFMILHMYIVPG